MVGIAGILQLAPGWTDGSAAALERQGAVGPICSGGRFVASGGSVAEADGVTVVIAGRLDRRNAPVSTQLGPGANDASIIAGAWRSLGADLVGQIDGRFCFALFDSASGELFLGRDRFGAEPLHLARLPDRIVFGSNAATVASLSGGVRTVDVDALAHCLVFGFPPPSRSAFRGVQPLPPAHRLLIGRDGLGEPSRYWELPHRAAGSAAEPREFADMLADAIRASVAAEADEGSSFDVAIGHPGGAVLAGALELSGNVGARELAPAADAAASVLDLIALTGEPLAALDAVRARRAFGHLAQRGGHLVLGCGADIALLSGARYGELAKALKEFRCDPDNAKIHGGYHEGQPFVRDIYARSHALAQDRDILAIAGPALAQSLLFCPNDEIGPALEDEDAESIAEAAARIDLTHGYRRLTAAFALARVERGVAVSAPFLSRPVMELCVAQPRDARIAAAKRIAQRRKGGAAQGDASVVPIGDCLRTALRERLLDTFASASFRRRDLVSIKALDAKVGQLMSGDDRHEGLLWSILCLETWFSSVVDYRGADRGFEAMGVAA